MIKYRYMDEYTDEQLKAMAYDKFTEQQKLNQELREINQEIARRHDNGETKTE